MLLILFLPISLCYANLGGQDCYPYSAEQRGSLYKDTFRIFLRDCYGNPISAMHDIPLGGRHGIYNMVVEIPRWTNAKMECNLEEKLNPIKHDTRNGQLRYVSNVFPFTGYMWNYGYFPQTWEDPEHEDPRTGYKGDGDPIDVVEIGRKVFKIGDVLKVKVLGIVALIDSDETDWKVITISVNDPWASKINTLGDVRRYMPGLLKSTLYWFKIYKTPTGNPPNKIVCGGEPQGKEFAYKVIRDTHELWKNLMQRSESHISRVGTVYRSKFQITRHEARKIINRTPRKGKPGTLPQSAQRWFYVDYYDDD